MARAPSVLLVEDNLDDIALVKEAFREAGIAAIFTLAHNAPQAFRLLLTMRDQPPELIILDLNLPIVRGHAILREFKAHPPWTHVPVIVFSSSTLPPDVDDALALGATEYVAKTGDLGGYLELARRARHLLDAAADPTPPRAEMTAAGSAWLAPFLVLDELAWPGDDTATAAG